MVIELSPKDLLMKSIVSLLMIFIYPLTAFTSESDKSEFLDIINSNIDFYSTVTSGMGFTGEVFSDLVYEDGNYLNCTIAMRGKSILINNLVDDQYDYSYQEHWIDINVREGNACDPSMYPTEHRTFVTMEKKRNILSVIDFVMSPDVLVEKLDAMIFLVKFSETDEESGEERKFELKYNLNFPLYLNPDSNGFRHRTFDYQGLDLSAISLCPPIEHQGECSELQDLSYLLKTGSKIVDEGAPFK